MPGQARRRDESRRVGLGAIYVLQLAVLDEAVTGIEVAFDEDVEIGSLPGFRDAMAGGIGWIRLNRADAIGIDTVLVSRAELLLVWIGIEAPSCRAEDHDRDAGMLLEWVRRGIGPDLGHDEVVEAEVCLSDHGFSTRLDSPEIGRAHV